jgi:hypothetical protein
MKVYYDGSVGKDDNGDVWITLGAIAATDSVWAEFDTKWSKMLRSRYPVAPYIHMIELLDAEDPFEPQAGWGQDEKLQLVQDAIVLLSQINKSEFVMAWSSINESERLRLHDRGETVPRDPYLFCTTDCLFLTLGGYIANVPDEQKEPICIFYDRGESFLGNFKNNWLQGRTKLGQIPNPGNAWDCFKEVAELDLSNHSGLHVADMVAWSHTRSLSDRERPFSWLKEWLVKVIPSFGIEHTEKTLLKAQEYRKGWERMFSRIAN